jgi:hypothetical protein
MRAEMTLNVRFRYRTASYYHAASGFLLEQNGGDLVALREALHLTWLAGFCQTAMSPDSMTLVQQRLLATSSIACCSALRSSLVRSHPFQYFFQLIGGPERIQYPPGRSTRSTSIRYSPSAIRRHGAHTHPVSDHLLDWAVRLDDDRSGGGTSCRAYRIGARG